MLATANLPDRRQPDLKAFCWTMESLTEDNEIKPFVEGIPGFIQTSSQGAPSAMVTLMHRDDIAIFGRVTKSLMTCMESGGLAGPSRRRRAVACMNVISVLVMLVDNDDWTSLDFFDSDIREAFSTLKSDSDSAIATAALDNIEILAAKLQRHIKAGLNKPYPSASMAIEHSLATVSALDSLYAWDSLDPVVTEISNPELEASPGFNRNLVLTCRTRHIPGLLSTCYIGGALKGVDRESRALASTKVVFYRTGAGTRPSF